MKLLYVYTSPSECFNEETNKLIEIQVDNNLELGWKIEDILLFTNFDYEYSGVKSIRIPNIQTSFDPSSNKVPIILYLMENKILNDNLCWYHDFDVYQLEQFIEPDIKIFGCAKYVYKKDWQCGSFFFRPSEATIDFFRLWNTDVEFIPTWSDYAKRRTDEKALKSLTIRGVLSVEEINHRYNHVFKFSDRTYDSIELPIIASHFHIDQKDAVDTMVHGMNKHGFPFVNQRLKNLFIRMGAI